MYVHACPVCNITMKNTIKPWHWACANCGYEKSDFEPAINNTVAHEKIDEQQREKGLRALRIANYGKLLDAIEKIRPTSGQLLDVGCAHGWFLEAAKNRGFDTLGIEPDQQFIPIAPQGVSMRQGFFPDVLEETEQFDVIVFNDVLEHMPDIKTVLSGCKKHLKPGGVLVINLPSTSGIFYNVARLLSTFGISSFFSRLWQEGFPSPHLHYFNPTNLRLLLQSNGFAEVTNGRLPTLRLRGLFARVSHTGGHSVLVSLAVTCITAVAIPIVWLMPGDIIYSISRHDVQK